jgi:nucleoside-diphosphate-sugar epimerase
MAAHRMRRILVTGASGFIGSHCVAPLQSRGFEVHAVSRVAPAEPPADGVVWHQADLLKASDRERVLGESAPTDLLHAAWDVTPGAYRDSPENSTWLAASLALLRAAIDSGTTRIVGLGSCAEYAFEGVCREDDTPLRPVTAYASAKATLGRALLDLNGADVSIGWGRVFFPFGPGEKPNRLMPAAIQSFIAGRPFDCSHGNQIRDFIYVEDLADAIAALVASPVTGACNLASGDPRSIRSLIESVARELGAEQLPRFGAVPVAGPDAEPLIAGDVTRLNTEVGWRPTIGVEQGIRRTIAWWENQPISSNSRRLA